MSRFVDVDELLKKKRIIGTSNYCEYNVVYVKDIEEATTDEVIPKADYEARLKADMVAILKELKSEIEKTVKEEELIDKKWANGLHYSEKIIQQKINALKEKDNGK